MWNVESEGEMVQGAPTIDVNGSVTELTAGADLKETVLGFARDAGFQKFRFFINDEEVLPQNAPDTIQAGSRYKISPFDVAG
jgi:hypothetical protein